MSKDIVKDENEIEPKKVSTYEFYFDTPLYDVIEVTTLEANILRGSVDGYNPISGFDTTYEIFGQKMDEYSWDHFYKVTLTCKRKGKDVLRFFIYHDRENTFKLGQFPSLADIQFSQIGKKYDKFLSREDLKEFKRAIGLAANGVGVGSFVYLRRIFENLIQQTFEENQALHKISETEFRVKRMEEKVEMLKIYLPTQLVEMKKIYKVLSDGVHNLSEEGCLAYFPALKLSIELILEQRIEMETKNLRDKAVKGQLDQISKSLG